MNIDAARKIDLWLGVPLCLFLNGIRYALGFMGLNKKPDRPAAKILFIKMSELGAIILSFPLLKQIRIRYPDARLFFLTFDKNKAVFGLLDGIIPDENILTIREEPRFFVFDTLMALARLRREGMDIIFDLEFFSRFTAIIGYLAGAGKVSGFHPYGFKGLYRGNLLTHKYPYNPLRHIVVNYLSLAQGIEEEKKEVMRSDSRINVQDIAFPAYVSKSKERDGVLGKLKEAGAMFKPGMRVFLINPGEDALPLREWPAENFLTLSRLLLEDINNCIILVGTQGAEAKAGFILKSLNNPRCLSLVGNTELGELLELFGLAEALVSNDCGLAHLAMLTSIKKFIIFGPESPRVFGPLGENNHIIYSDWPCSPCLSVLNHRDSACRDNRCLKAVDPAEVYELIRGFKDRSVPEPL